MNECEPNEVMSTEIFARAERFLPENARSLIDHDEVKPKWLDDGLHFWYRDRTPTGHSFKLVDPCQKTVTMVFDHQRLAAQLTRLTDASFDGDNLPFEEIDLQYDEGIVEFEFDGTRWSCDLSTYECTKIDDDSERQPCSPDGKWAVGVEDHNLYVRNAESGDKKQLTEDAHKDTAYATPLPSPIVLAELDEEEDDKPEVEWSPDSSKFVTFQIDKRQAETLDLLQSVPTDGSMRPKTYTYVYPLPGDGDVATASYHIFDVMTGEKTTIDLPPAHCVYYGSPGMQKVWWSSDGDCLYALRKERGYQCIKLFRVDPETGDAELLVKEASETGINVGPTYGREAIELEKWMILEDAGEILWYSYRNGWGHLYLYDSESGELKHQITEGPWVVREVLFVDEEHRMVYFTASGRESGRDPYYRHLYRISLDGGEEELLTPQDADHEITFSPCGAYFVDSYSRVDRPPVALLKNADGSCVMKLEEADIGRLEDAGWRHPVRFRVKARDGATDICGVMIFPSDFDPDKKYPVIDGIYAGPHTNRAPVRFTGGERSRQFWHDQALANLGFVVVNVDGLGMPFRSSRYSDYSYRNLADAGLADHIAALQQLQDQYQCLNLERVGIYGYSAGGYSSTQAMLAYPDFYKVAVSWAGNHDHRMDKASWVEMHMGLPVEEHYHEQSNVTMAENLKGKLLLMHGDMDENVHVSSTLKVVDALVEANKDFDMFILPNGIHRSGNDPYITRKRWEYFVRHLLNQKPPKEYEFGTFSEA